MQLGSQPGVSSVATPTQSTFEPLSSAARRKRQTLNGNGCVRSKVLIGSMLFILHHFRSITCERATGLFGDILVVRYILKFPNGCVRSCRRRFRIRFIALVRRNYQRFTLTVNFTVGGVKQVTCAFCGVFGSSKSSRETKIKSYQL